MTIPERRNHLKLLRTQGKEFLPWATAALLALSTNWAADAIPPTLWACWHWLATRGERMPFDVGRAGAIGFFALSLFALYKQRSTFFKPRTRFLRNEKPEPRKCLILFLSDLRGDVAYVDGIPEGLTLSGDLDADLQAMAEYKNRTKKPWAWEMGLRGIRAHLGRLETVTVVCSTRTIHYAHHFLAILNCYKVLGLVSKNVLTKEGELSNSEVTTVSLKDHSGIDFESFDQLSDCLWAFIRQSSYPEEEVMIDFTGGQKVTSVVAAALTSNRKFKAQYVQTNEPWEPISYDVVHAVFESGSMG